MEYLVTALCGVIAYLLGSINSSILVGKLFGIRDIRAHGSGNAGATNTLRTIGKRAAILALVGDVCKGLLAVFLARVLTGALIASPGVARFAVLLAAFCAVLGHNYPLYFGLKGGKGIVTSAAVIYMLDWRIGLMVTAAAILIIAVSRYVSLGSIVGCLLFPVLAAIFMPGDTVFIVFAAMISLLAVFRHSQNIRRLIAGTENKLGSKKKE